MNHTCDYIKLDDLLKCVVLGKDESINELIKFKNYGDDVDDLDVRELLSKDDKTSLESDICDILSKLKFNMNVLLDNLLPVYTEQYDNEYFTHHYNLSKVDTTEGHHYNITRCDNSRISTESLNDINLDSGGFMFILNTFAKIVKDGTYSSKRLTNYSYPEVYEGLDPSQVMELVKSTLDSRFPEIKYLHVKTLEEESIQIKDMAIYNDYINGECLTPKALISTRELRSIRTDRVQIRGFVILTYLLNLLP